MALSAGNAASINKRNIAALAGSLGACAKVMPKAVTAAANATAVKIKPQWYGIMEAKANTKPTSKIKGRSWRLTDSVKGDTPGKASLIVGMSGPMWLVIFPTKAHPITAKRLGKNWHATGVKASATVRTGAKYTNVKVAGVKVGRVQTKAAGTKTRAGAQALLIPGVNGPRAWAMHRGTKGHRDAWEAMKVSAALIGPATFKAEGQKALAMEFGKAATKTGRALL